MDNTHCANDYIIKWFDINQYFLLNIDIFIQKNNIIVEYIERKPIPLLDWAFSTGKESTFL